MKISRTLPSCLILATVLSLLMTLPSDRASGIGGSAPAQEVSIEIADTGFSPATVLVTAGANIHWTNNATSDQTVTSDSGLFDSATLAPSDGFSINLAIPGHHHYASADNPAFTGTIKVVLGGIEGPPDGLANDYIPDLDFPPIELSDYATHPTLAIGMSRTRIRAGFAADATVAQANAALQNAGVGVLGGIPEFETVLVEVEDGGDFAHSDAAVIALRAEPAIAFAAPVAAIDTDQVPRVWEGNDATRTWDVVSSANGDPGGTGDNYQLEIARFPQAWNLLETIRTKATALDSGVLDVRGYGPHVDLQALTPQSLCTNAIPAVCTANTPSEHAMHVAGIVGAAYDNPAAGGIRSVGVSGTNPVASTNGFTLSTPGGQLDDVQAWRALLGRKLSDLPNLRVVNYSVGYQRPNPATWWAAHPEPICGPGANDDAAAGSSLWCDWTNEDGWLARIANDGPAYRNVAEVAAARGVTIVKSAGNYSDDFCGSVVDADDNNTISAAEITAFVNGGDCSSDLHPFDAERTGGFGWAARHWTEVNLASPILVEAHDWNRIRTQFANFGEVSAPGRGIRSTVPGDLYADLNGTSMAAPHVTGLVGYLLAYEPDLTPEEVRALVLDWARTDADYAAGTTPRLDAFMSLMAIPGAANDLVDVNDASVDGNLRVTLNADGSTTDVVVAAGAARTAPDGVVNMRDFRRFRDALLQRCIEVNCPDSANVNLNGANTLLQKDLNFDGCVTWGASTLQCPTAENVFPRFDFNGDGVMHPTQTSRMPLDTNGAVAGAPNQATAMTDLDVLQSQWDSDLGRTEGYTAADLDELLTSGDTEIHADDFFTAGATSVQITVRRTDLNTDLPARTLLPGEGFIVITVPRTDVTVTASAIVAGKIVVSSPAPVTTLPEGKDVRIDLKPSGLQLAVDKQSLPADGAATATVKVTLTDGGVASPGKNITLTLSPTGTSHASLESLSGVTDANGEFQTTFRAGTIVVDYTITATADLGGTQNPTTQLILPVRPVINIYYYWKQENLEWTQTGDTVWAPPLTPGQPDCTVPGVVPYCITLWEVSLRQPAAPIERSGVLRGHGSAFKLDERVNDPLLVSDSTWTSSNPDLTNPLPQGKTAGWSVDDAQLTRYTGHALPPSLHATDTPDGIDLRGLAALADLEYEYAGGAVPDLDTTQRVELGDIISTLVLGPVRGDASSIQYAPCGPSTIHTMAEWC